MQGTANVKEDVKSHHREQAAWSNDLPGENFQGKVGKTVS